MPSDLDQALLLYFDGQQDKPSTQEPRKPLNFVNSSVFNNLNMLAINLFDTDMTQLSWLYL